MHTDYVKLLDIMLIHSSKNPQTSLVEGGGGVFLDITPWVLQWFRLVKLEFLKFLLQSYASEKRLNNTHHLKKR